MTPPITKPILRTLPRPGTPVPYLSIVIPTLGEAENIGPLLVRIDQSLRRKAIYEVIIVDDHSTDATVKLAKNIAYRLGLPVRVYTKVGTPGKAFSLIEGFTHARYKLICMIDADLQYPPEAIPAMITALRGGKDIIVGNRAARETNLMRRSLSNLSRNVFGSWLHGLDCDVQSGLKLFRKDILYHISLSPTSWTFDIEFLVHARNAGYTIGAIYVPFAARVAGKSKIHLFKDGLEILKQSVKIKFTRPKAGIVRANKR